MSYLKGVINASSPILRLQIEALEVVSQGDLDGQEEGANFGEQLEALLISLWFHPSLARYSAATASGEANGSDAPAGGAPDDTAPPPPPPPRAPPLAPPGAPPARTPPGRGGGGGGGGVWAPPPGLPASR